MADKEALLEEIGADVKSALKAHRNGDVPPQLLRELAVENPSRNVKIFLASYSDTPSRILESLFDTEEDTDILAALADNPRTPKIILQHLARHDNPQVRKVVAVSRTISPQTALILSGDEDPVIRAALAGNGMITSRVQVKLSEDPVPFVRSALLSSPRLDAEIYAALAEDMDPVVQARCLSSPKVPEETMLQWADSDEHFPQEILLGRKNLPEKILESLCFSSHPSIQKQAVSRKILTLDEMIGFSKNGDKEVRQKIARMPNLPALVQTALADDEDPEVLAALASCPVLTAETADALAESREPNVIEALAENLNTPADSLVKLASSGNMDVLKSLTARSCPREVMDILFERGDDDLFYHLAYNRVLKRGQEVEGIPPQLLVYLAEHQLPTLRCMAAVCRDLPVFQMAKLARDPSSMVRRCLALNQGISSSVLELLADDADSRVKSAAKSMSARLAAAKIAEVTTPESTESPQQLEQDEDTTLPDAEEYTPPESGGKSFLQRIIKRMTGDN